MTTLTDDRIWLAWTGMETDLIFNQGVDLPGFAAFPMIDNPEGRARLRDYYAGPSEGAAKTPRSGAVAGAGATRKGRR